MALTVQFICNYILVSVDFTNRTTQLTFAATSGPFTTLDFQVPISNDGRPESEETIPLLASGVPDSVFFTDGKDRADIIINDDDGKL